MNRLACFLLLILLSCGTASALSRDGGGIWGYSQDIIVQENSGNAFKDCNILVKLEDNNFPAEAQKDGIDIRFTDEDNNELDYWIEKFDFSAKKAEIWVKIPYISANSQTKITMYYGNPEASPVSVSKLLTHPDVSGSWTGTLYQYNTGTEYSFNLHLSQEGSKISGNSKISRESTSRNSEITMFGQTNNKYAVMDISGTIDNKTLSFTELRITKEYPSNSGFFLKDVDLRFEGKSPSTLEGNWNNKTYGGKISLRRDLPKTITNVTIHEPRILSVFVTKTVSPQSIRQFNESTITIKIKNIGRTEITDIEVIDSTNPPSFDFMRGNYPDPHKFDILEPGDTKWVQYTIRANKNGTFILDPCTVTFADKDRNIQEIKSEAVSLKVIPSISSELKANNEVKNPIFKREGLTEDSKITNLLFYILSIPTLIFENKEWIFSGIGVLIVSIWLQSRRDNT